MLNSSLRYKIFGCSRHGWGIYYSQKTGKLSREDYKELTQERFPTRKLAREWYQYNILLKGVDKEDLSNVQSLVPYFLSRARRQP